MDLSQIMSMGQNPEIVTKMPDKMLETLNVLNQYIPTIYSTELEKYKNQLASLQFLYERLKDEMAYLRVYTDELKSVAQLLNAARQWGLLPYLIAEKQANVELKKVQKAEKIQKIKEKKEKKEKEKKEDLVSKFLPQPSGQQPPYLKEPPEKVK
ncbi:MAG: hypothetical protein ACP5HJ_04090, partial [Candidatus Micrarchaeia archaeon]